MNVLKYKKMNLSSIPIIQKLFIDLDIYPFNYTDTFNEERVHEFQVFENQKTRILWNFLLKYLCNLRGHCNFQLIGPYAI